MLTVNLICVGSLKERYWREACAEYVKRLSAFCNLTVLELPETRLPDRPSAAEIAKALEAEGKAILAKAGNSAVIPLCIEGRQLSSPGLAELLDGLALSGTSAVSFVIGSSYGLADPVKQRGIKRLSMSEMTFPHQLARVMLLEQIYRAFTINGNGKYHK
ncbi:MAG: 23S rRNA (pseudouridine(1915)-N(3))-methyltransferase RlmH [Oscillospiraceae bacterium]|nr:23S rRNA (pseudouridine(1915)-N(3))-methyltransferase RlmH [Oscillospiraceae bacterium]